MNPELLIENITRICKENNVTPTKAFIESGAGKNFIFHIKKGQTPSVERVQLLADYLGVTTSDLLGEKKPPVSEDDERLKVLLANADDETREIIALLDQLNPGNLERAKEYIRFEIARQGDAGDKQ